MVEGAISLASCTAFHLEDADLSYRLEAGEERSFSVRFTPPSVSQFDCRVGLGSEACGSLWVRGSGQAPADCVVDAPIRDFGTVALGEWKELSLSLRNAGGKPLSGLIDLRANFPVFSVDGQSSVSYELGANATRAFVLRFTPSASGAQTLALDPGNDLCGGAISFTARGDDPPACQIEPAGALVFPTLVVGATDTLSFRVRNVGGGTLDGSVSPLVGCTGFSLQGSLDYSLVRGESKRVVVRFSPSTVGVFACTTDPGTGCGAIELQGSAEDGPICQVGATDGLEFGVVSIGGSASKSLTITNTGGGTLIGTISEACPDFVVQPTTYSLAGGAEQEFTVQFHPISVGPHSCSINLGSSCGSLVYSGTGEAAPECEVEPATGLLSFGTIAVGSSSDLGVLIRNTGGGTLSGTVTVPSGGDADQFQIQGSGFYSLLANQSTTILVRFAPTSAGTKGVVLNLGSGLCRTVSCEGVGDPPPSCSLTTDDLDFGNVAVGGIPSTKTLSFRIENTGGGTLTGSVGSGCGAFVVIAGGGSYQLVHGQRRTVQVRFTPVALGPTSCDLNAGTSCGNVTLRGNGAVSFAATLVSILTGSGGTGCAQGGTCHVSGGSVPYWGDYATTRDRVSTSNPPGSLLLLKALGESHSGGVVWDTSFLEYRRTLTWIQEGALDN